MTSEETSMQDKGPNRALFPEAPLAASKHIRKLPTTVLAPTVLLSLALGAGIGYTVAHSSTSTGASTTGEAPTISGISKKNVCKLVSEAMQRDLSIRAASPMAEDQGGASCYLSMTEDDAAEPAGFVVAFYPTSKSLQQTVDGTDVIPEKAEPLLVHGRAAARQVLYGDTWKAQLTLDVGKGAVLYVERYGPKDSLSERELRRSVDDLAASVLEDHKA
ncbi:hypothetical protein [Streptomyces sp. NPDC002176]|uniref:hypothetical protein n=1 Tax=Streptomyces sp. NPDC002176 TaxID=3364634 RepID=UPI00384B0453